MTYPPTTPGYPPQPSGSYGAGPTFTPPGADLNKLPGYLTVVVALCGFAAYLASFGPVFTVDAPIGPFDGAELTGSGGGYPIVAALVAALLAAVSCLSKTKNYDEPVAAISVLAVMLVIAQVISKPTGFAIGWALWLVLLLTLCEAVSAVAVVLLRAGIITAPTPRRPYDYSPDYGSAEFSGQEYGQFRPQPGAYYGSYAGQPQQPAGPPPGYPSSYAGGYPPNPAPGGFVSPLASSGPPTPPTGFPSAGSPPSPSSGQHRASPDQQPQTPPSGSAPSS